MATKKTATTRRTTSRRADDERLRVRNLIRLDAANIIGRLDARKGEMIALFSRLRDRSALLEPLKSWFPSATFHELRALETVEQNVANDFYEAVERLRWYFQYTDDMPGTAQQVFEVHHRRLREAHQRLAELLEEPPARPKATARKSARKTARKSATRTGRKVASRKR